ncbi:hypothetical protein [Phaeobacter sp. C3_T13_0]|uniref:hypothetical protein n=1 Tax=Phaeobacter cretensis TaxID=3342641 RepID=UPI0039BD0FB4
MITQVSSLPRALFVTLPDGQPLPELEVTTGYAPNEGWRLIIDVKNFTFTDLCVSKANNLAIGHAHVHLGTQKIMTAYQPNVFIGHLPRGQHSITVSLRAQDHRVLGRPGGGMFSKTITLKVP